MFMPQQSWGFIASPRTQLQMVPGLNLHKFFGAGKAISFPVIGVCLSSLFVSRLSVCEVQRSTGTAFHHTANQQPGEVLQP